MGLLQILTFLSLFLLAYTYLIYPVIMWLLARNRSSNAICFERPAEFPTVFFFMPMHNEAEVLEEKIASLKQLRYPGQIHFFLGSDNSSDGTVEMIRAVENDFEHFNFFVHNERQGKPTLVNKMVDEARKHKGFENSILMLSDASVMLEENCLVEMVKHFKNPDIFLVDAHMKSLGTKAGGISNSEGVYIQTEGKLKQWESIVHGKMMGPFGGCYTIRSSHFSPVPDNFLVDDFFITLSAYKKGGKKAICAPTAICYEKVGYEQNVEFNRKRRISAGNYQNMMHFFSQWFPPRNALSLAFFSHKILRWTGPFFIIFATIGTAILAFQGQNILYPILLVLLGVWFFVIPILDSLLKAIGINWTVTRNIAYFNMMNLALLMGFFKYVYGIKSNVWQPPKRT